jgi:hypothetical protein
MTYGPQLLAAITDVLGATANAGIFIVEVLARVVGLTALPLGIALLATQPLVRLAQTRQAYSLSPGPPDIEALDSRRHLLTAPAIGRAAARAAAIL